tara:strand:+ start:575 stop:1513 length:939 start_codon:yes stop_codon:yes gene_type:complete
MSSDDQWIVYEGREGPGSGKHVVLISGDEEYRSEEALPMLGNILATHHGFKCTVLFAIDRETGEINPDEQSNIPGLENLDGADLMVLFTRFRELPDDQMQHIINFTNRGGPVIGLRTATHAFNYSLNLDSPYAKYSFNSEEFEGGFGRQVLGETWVNHHGHHAYESARGVINEASKDHPILKGVDDIWAPSDVYSINELTGDSQVLVDGQVLVGMKPDDEVNTEKPTMPVAWFKTYTGDEGNTSRVFCTTMGASVDLESAGLRRLVVNACYWGMGMEDKIPAESNVDYVGDYNPTFFGFGDYAKGIKPAALR